MDAYRTTTQPTPQHKPRMEWRIDVSDAAKDAAGAVVLYTTVSWLALAAAFVWSGAVPYVMRWALMNVVATLAWCACFVRRREVTP